MKDEDLIRNYLQTKSTKQTAEQLGVVRYKVTNRLTKLRKNGVEIPRYGYSKALKPEDVDRLNLLVRSLNGN